MGIYLKIQGQKRAILNGTHSVFYSAFWKFVGYVFLIEDSLQGSSICYKAGGGGLLHNKELLYTTLKESQEDEKLARNLELSLS